MSNNNLVEQQPAQLQPANQQQPKRPRSFGNVIDINCDQHLPSKSSDFLKSDLMAQKSLSKNNNHHQNDCENVINSEKMKKKCVRKVSKKCSNKIDQKIQPKTKPLTSSSSNNATNDKFLKWITKPKLDDNDDYEYYILQLKTTFDSLLAVEKENLRLENEIKSLRKKNDHLESLKDQYDQIYQELMSD